MMQEASGCTGGDVAHGGAGPVAAAVRAKLMEAFAPSLLVIEDESHRHAGHAGGARADGVQGETHFRIAITAAAFAGLGRVARHRMVNAVLADELHGPVHALALAVRAPGE